MANHKSSSHPLLKAAGRLNGPGVERSVCMFVCFLCVAFFSCYLQNSSRGQKKKSQDITKHTLCATAGFTPAKNKTFNTFDFLTFFHYPNNNYLTVAGVFFMTVLFSLFFFFLSKNTQAARIHKQLI